jgi:LAS superfamily LD-carboxypeptidase LdcB
MTTSVSWDRRLPFAPLAEDAPIGPPAADRLTWEGATPEQQDFMRRVYRRHVASSAKKRPFVASVPQSERAIVEHGQWMRTAAAERCRAMLAAARTDVAAEQASGSEAALAVRGFGARSGYRSVETQFTNWESTFRKKYYPDTATQRAGLSGGEHGDAAVAFMVSYIGNLLAAPGYSLHNDGLAMDFFTREGRTELGPTSGKASVAAWRRSWLFTWMSQHASEYRFFQNTSIVEPWHWEYRASAATETLIPAGRLELSHVPPLATHVGTQPDLILRWNEMSVVPSSVDVVLFLHGFANAGGAMRLDQDIEPKSGLDFDDPSAPGAGHGRTRPTLGIIPRGSHIDGKKYEFPVFDRPGALDAVIDYALAEFAATLQASRLKRERLIITAHSGGGKALRAILARNDPDEVFVFDALYWSSDTLVHWATQHIRRDAECLNAGGALGDAGACRVLFTDPNPPAHGTKPESIAAHRALQRALKAAGAARSALERRYRVEVTSVPHTGIPAFYGWRLLADPGANLPRASSP